MARIGLSALLRSKSLLRWRAGARSLLLRDRGSELYLGALLLAACALVALGSAGYANYSVQQILRAETSRVADEWATQLVERVPGIEGLANGRKPTQEETQAMAAFERVGSVFLFKLFDLHGGLRLVSDERHGIADTGRSLAEHNPTAALAVSTGQIFVDVKDGFGKPNRPLHYSEAYVPISKENRVFAAVEVYIDQTSRRNEFQKHAANAAVFTSLLAGVAFGVPAFAFYLRTKQVARAGRRLEFMRQHDLLTLLPNRSYFLAALERAVFATKNGSKFGLLYMNLDRFKRVNDTFGHELGDKLLRGVGERLLRSIRPSDALARMDGDEFAVIQTDVRSADDCEKMAARLVAALAQPFDIDGHRVEVGVSIGIALGPDDATNAEAFLKAANIALRRAKSDGRGRMRFFEPGMDAELKKRRAMEDALRAAVGLGQFELRYQPQKSLIGDSIVGFEALLRWHHPEMGWIPPSDFIPLAEETGSIADIGRWVLQRACADATVWPKGTRLAVNLSSRQIESNVIVRDVEHALQQSGLEPGRLELEITEGALLNDTKSTIDALWQLKQLGTHISIDDFGTGYSSLSYLQKFPIDRVKIDKSFVDRIERAPDAFMIVRAILNLCKSLGKGTTAEGVESVEQVLLLQDEGCDEIQGYFVGRPMPVDETLRFLEQQRAQDRP